VKPHDKFRDRIANAIRKHGGTVKTEVPLGKSLIQKYKFWKSYDPNGDWKGQVDVYMYEPFELPIEVCGETDLYAKDLQKVRMIKKLCPQVRKIVIFEWNFLDDRSESGKQFKLWTGRKPRDYAEIQRFVLMKWKEENCLPKNLTVEFWSEKDLEKLENDGLSALSSN
jgi:hypothetical protein